jgi:hypothetical protein
MVGSSIVVRLAFAVALGGVAYVTWSSNTDGAKADETPRAEIVSDADAPSATPQEAASVVPGRAVTAANLPLLFAENKGQFPSDARFSARYRGINTFVTAEGFRFGLLPPEAIRFDPKAEDPFADRVDRPGANVFFTFEGGSSEVAVEGENLQPTRFNYFTGPNEASWTTDVPTYSGVRHRDMYAGVDVVIGDRAGRLEYDVVVKPGGDLRDVVVRVDGAEQLRLQGDGSLLAETAAGPFLQTAPVAFALGQNGESRSVPCSFELLDDKRFRFVAAEVAEGETLLVDPGLVYAYMVSGSLADQGYAVDGDPVEKVFLGGRSVSNNFPVVAGSFDVTLTSGNFDGFVGKIDPVANTLVYCSFLGAAGMDYVAAVAVDGAGFLYATGQAGSSGFPSTTGAYDTSYNGQGDGFVTKFNQAGSALVYSTFVGGTAEDKMHGIKVDAAGAAYIVGQTLSHVNYPGAATQTIPTGVNYNVGAVNWNVCATKVNPVGNGISYSFRTGGNALDWAYGLTVDAAGSLYVVGGTNSSTFPTASAYDATANGNYDAFIFKVNATGSAFVFSTYLGTAGADQAFAVDVDAYGFVYVGGIAGIGMPTTPGVWDSTGDGADGFVAKFDPSGLALVWCTYLGGSSTDQINGLKVDHGLRPVVGGWTNSADFPTTPSGYDTTYGGGGSPAEGFLVKLTWTGSALLYGSFVGGDGNDEIDGVQLDANGWAYAAGVTLGSSAASFLPCSFFNGGACGAEEAWTAKFELPASPSVTVVGQGCASSPLGGLAPTPTMTSTLPTLGETLLLSGVNCAPAVPGLVILSVVPGFALPVNPWCTVYFDVFSLMPLSAYIPDPFGAWVSAIYVQDEPSWSGAVVRVQSVAINAMSPWGFELTNALDLEFGY